MTKSVVGNVNFLSYYNSYSNIALTESPDLVQLAPSLSFVVSLHLIAMFNFFLEVEQTIFNEDITSENQLGFPTLQGTGLGFQVDFPGFFFVGARLRDLVQTGKKYPFNTFGYATAMQLSKMLRGSTASSKTVVSKMGLGIDTFLFNQAAYFTLRVGTVIIEGDAFFNHGLGLGVNF